MPSALRRRYSASGLRNWNYNVIGYDDGAVIARKIAIAFLELAMGTLFSGRICRGIRGLLERPIRNGDLVEVDGVHGIIQHVGARSTRLLTSQNIHLLIPNSSLLVNTVVNWTLSGEKIFTKVAVGVAYGSPTDIVASAISEAASCIKAVWDTPKPIVLFTDFGDNALGFEVHFWIRMRRIMDKRQAESEMRFNIERVFREHGICIALPQRDIHLDTVRPLELRILPEEGKGGDG